MMLDAERVERYLDRLGLARMSLTPTAQLLRTLHRRHVETVPFENFSIHLGETIELDPDRLVDKITEANRGGFCYELNGAFAALLSALGFTVSLLEARVYAPDGEPGIAFDHLCLEVVADQPYLVDVGFGRGFLEPLALDRDGPRTDPCGTFDILGRDDGWFDLVHQDQALYRFSRTPRVLAEFADACVHHQTSPDSIFTANTICSLPSGAGRTTLRGLTLITSADAQRTERTLSEDEWRPLLASAFGIVLSGSPFR